MRYLHGGRPPVVRPANVLVDRSFSAKLADFGALGSGPAGAAGAAGGAPADVCAFGVVTQCVSRRDLPRTSSSGAAGASIDEVPLPGLKAEAAQVPDAGYDSDSGPCLPGKPGGGPPGCSAAVAAHWP